MGFWISPAGLLVIVLGFALAVLIGIVYGVVGLARLVRALVRDPSRFWAEARTGTRERMRSVYDFWRMLSLPDRLALPLLPIVVPVFIWLLIRESGS